MDGPVWGEEWNKGNLHKGANNIRVWFALRGQGGIKNGKTRIPKTTWGERFEETRGKA